MFFQNIKCYEIPTVPKNKLKCGNVTFSFVAPKSTLKKVLKASRSSNSLKILSVRDFCRMLTHALRQGLSFSTHIPTIIVLLHKLLVSRHLARLFTYLLTKTSGTVFKHSNVAIHQPLV